MEIPHIETRWDYRLKRDDYSVNLYPHPTAISKVNQNMCDITFLKPMKLYIDLLWYYKNRNLYCEDVLRLHSNVPKADHISDLVSSLF